MNAGFVRESIGSDNSLVGRRAESDDLAEHLAGGVELLELDAGVDAVAIGPYIECGGDLFECRVAGALADAVDGALHLARTGCDGGERIGCGEAEVVVAMRGGDGALGIDAGDALAHFAE